MLKPSQYRKINREVMTDTKKQCQTHPDLIKSIQDSVASQFMVSHEDNIDQEASQVCETEYIVKGGRSFAMSQQWAVAGMKVAVLNFANNHSIGGAPYSAGAQEESLCRCSTLHSCLEDMRQEFYQKHIDLYEAHKIDYMGNDDLIYTPNVCVFKTDEQTDPIYPKMMPRDQWYYVDVITCAAPELWHGNRKPADYESQINSRIKKIVDVAWKQKVEVLVLGAWGCGAFKNPEDVVARLFHEHLRRYDFKKVIFAMGRMDYENSAFYAEFAPKASPVASDTVTFV